MRLVFLLLLGGGGGEDGEVLGNYEGMLITALGSCLVSKSIKWGGGGGVPVSGS